MNGVQAFKFDEQRESKQLRLRVDALEEGLKRQDAPMFELEGKLIEEKKK